MTLVMKKLAWVVDMNICGAAGILSAITLTNKVFLSSILRSIHGLASSGNKTNCSGKCSLYFLLKMRLIYH